MSSVMMAALIGTIYGTPRSPSGISRLRAASGPYAAELSPSRPKIGMPCIGPICSARSSLVLMGLPTMTSSMFMSDSNPRTRDLSSRPSSSNLQITALLYAFAAR